MIENDTDMKPDRRRGADFWVKILRWLGVFGWFVMIVALFIIDRARPEEENMFTKSANISVRKTWNPELIHYLFYLMIFGLCISVIGIVINSRRHHRADDRFRYILIILGIISLFGIIKYHFKF
jgi:uncharacterized membrane protein YhaH (DUF805 family)